MQLLHRLYDLDIVSEEAVLKWAEEKEHADEEEKVYLRKASRAPVLCLLQRGFGRGRLWGKRFSDISQLAVIRRQLPHLWCPRSYSEPLSARPALGLRMARAGSCSRSQLLYGARR